MFGGRRLYTKTLQTGDLKEAQRKRANFDRLVVQAEEAPSVCGLTLTSKRFNRPSGEAEQRIEAVVLPGGQEVVVEPEGLHHAYDVEAAIARG